MKDTLIFLGREKQTGFFWVLYFLSALRPEQFNFLFFDPTKLRFSKIEKKFLKNPSWRKRKIKKGLGIFPFKRFFLYLCLFRDEICAFNFDRKPTRVHMRDKENCQ